ncbi:MAG: hypothetical protein IPO21_17005 [Bacteroidales bacterium]|nr:hypothetical protein [Bacteroidales bacterium]
MKQKKRITIRIFMLLVSMVFAGSLLAQTVPLVYDVENTGASCSVTYGNLSTTLATLPDPFTMNDGTKVSTFDGWKCRRNEIKKDLEQYEIGTKPDKPQNITATYSGGTLTVNVTISGQTLTLTSKLNIPSGAGPHPVVIGMNSATGGVTASLFSGCITMPFTHDQIVNYNMNSQQRQTDPYYKIFPDLWGKIGNYSAWSWGISRLIDGLELVKDQINVDMKRIAVTGCSYAGKMALFGGALDERIALTIVQESGGGGISSWRLSQAFTTRTGTEVEKIDNTNYSWFKTSMKTLKPNTLPHDHHELIAMIAPRAVLILGNPYQEWLGDESGYKSTMAALEVWKAMKVEDRFGYDFASGHEHCQLATSQSTACQSFINKFLKTKLLVPM